MKKKLSIKLQTITVKLAFIFICMSIVSISIVDYINYKSSYKSIQEQSKNLSKQTLEYVDLVLDNYLGAWKNNSA